jgi:hypothetical protein
MRHGAGCGFERLVQERCLMVRNLVQALFAVASLLLLPASCHGRLPSAAPAVTVCPSGGPAADSDCLRALGGSFDLDRWASVPAFPAGSADEACAEAHACAWSLCSDGAGVKVRGEGVAEKAEPTSGLPRELGNAPGILRTHPFAGGYLVGLDRGASGSRLVWMDSEEDVQVISGDRVLGFADTPGGTVAVVAVAGAEREAGKVLLFGGEPWSAKVVAEIPGAPRSFAVDPSGAVVVVAEDELLRIAPSGAVAHLGKLTPGMSDLAAASSMVLGKDGSVYASGRNVVVRFSPKAGGYQETWLAPPTCASHEAPSCRCRETTGPR